MRTGSMIVALCWSLSACNQPAAEPAPAANTESEPGVPSAAPAAPVPAAQPAAPAAPAPAAGPAAHADHPAAPEGLAVPLPDVPPGARVMFTAPADGAKLEGPLENGKVAVKVVMGAQGIAIKPAGPVESGSGHHHLLIDAAPIEAGTVVPKDDTHLHFGQAQTEADIALTPGEHTLTLQLADGIHRSYGPPLAATIKVDVQAKGAVEPAKPLKQ